MESQNKYIEAFYKEQFKKKLIRKIKKLYFEDRKYESNKEKWHDKGYNNAIDSILLIIKTNK